jgi:hypothetical protein
MEKWQIVDDLEDIQERVDKMGFKGSNEKELWTRDLISDYIFAKFTPKTTSPPKEAKIIGSNKK